MYKFSVFLLCVITAYSQAQSIDPTKPFGLPEQGNTTAVKKGQLVLQTIVEQGENKSVVINGELLNVGDQISQYKLLKITKNHVVLSSPERDLTLSLFSSVVAKSK